MCKSWVKEVYGEKGQPGCVEDLNGSELWPVRWKAGTAGDKAGEVNRDLCGRFSNVHAGDCGLWKGNTYPNLKPQLRLTRGLQLFLLDLVCLSGSEGPFHD